MCATVKTAGTARGTLLAVGEGEGDDRLAGRSAGFAKANHAAMTTKTVAASSNFRPRPRVGAD